MNLSEQYYNEIFDEAQYSIWKDEIKKALDTLTLREREIISQRFGLFDECPKTTKELSELHNRTKSRIGQIEAKTMRKLMHPARSDRLRGLLD